MEEYKGIYHNVQDKTKLFEFGAHFKYSELYNALMELQLKEQKENIHLDIEEKEKSSSSKNKHKEEHSHEKKRKKYKLKTHINEHNNRYLNTDINKKDNEKNEFSVIEEENDNKKEAHTRKKHHFITKSVEKIQLPNISSNSIISLQNKVLQTEPHEAIKLHYSHDFHKKKINFPKLNSLHKNDILPEIHNVETQSKFQDNAAVKIYNDSFEKNQMMPFKIKYNNDKSFPKLFQLSKDSEEKVELSPKHHTTGDKLLSIFETEKKIKNNNLFLGEKNNYMNKELRDLKNEHMAQQIHNLKMKLLGNSKKNLKHIYQ